MTDLITLTLTYAWLKEASMITDIGRQQDKRDHGLYWFCQLLSFFTVKQTSHQLSRSSGASLDVARVSRASRVLADECGDSCHGGRILWGRLSWRQVELMSSNFCVCKQIPLVSSSQHHTQDRPWALVDISDVSLTVSYIASVLHFREWLLILWVMPEVIMNRELRRKVRENFKEERPTVSLRKRVSFSTTTAASPKWHHWISRFRQCWRANI